MELPRRLNRDGATIDPGVAEDQIELDRLRRRRLAGLLDGMDKGSLRPGPTLNRAIDTCSSSPVRAAYETLVHLGGYSMEEFERWFGDTLVAALLADPRT
jgi:hypothetical protein